MKSMVEVVGADRLEQLEALAEILSNAIDKTESARDLPQLARQYRETIREIAEIRGDVKEDDEIAKLLAERDAVGVSKSVR